MRFPLFVIHKCLVSGISKIPPEFKLACRKLAVRRRIAACGSTVICMLFRYECGGGIGRL